jgi:formiminotetrahydrofolate cyclodeaminase
MERRITENTAQQFIAEVSDQPHAMAGAVIALSAAQAAALGRACMHISNADSLESIDGICNQLSEWCDRDAVAIAEFVALREAGDELSGQQLLCDAPAQVCRLSIEAAVILQNFRPQVSERVQDDLEMSIRLLTGAAQAALLLLDSNLRIWPEPDLLAQFEPIFLKLEQRIGQLTPVARLRAG